MSEATITEVIERTLSQHQTQLHPLITTTYEESESPFKLITA